VLALGLAILGVVVAAIAAGGAIWQASLLRKQLASDNTVRRASFYQEITKLILQLDYIFVENPAWRPYFYEDQVPPDSQVEGQLLSLSEYIADIAESCTAAEEALPELLGDWDDFFNYLYRNSPVLRRYWADFGHLYPARVARCFIGPSARPKIWPTAPHKASNDDSKQDQTHPLCEAEGTLATAPSNQLLLNAVLSHTEVEMSYSEGQAATYGDIALEGSTYAVSLLPAISSLGDITGITVLDFGAGTGRSARALLSHNAGLVVAVDKDANMLKVAERYPGVIYLQAGRSLPIAERSMDAALCANVFPEFSSLDDIAHSCREIRRTLKPGRFFVVVVPNPESISCNYVSYRYVNVENLDSGSPITCLIKEPKPIFIQDYYWSSSDYISAIESAGFEIDELLLPIAQEGKGIWLDETNIAPDLVIRCVRTD
jgi:SAM-dependent methyltransferase